ncbi:MAG TPA: toll/interleukin-1 receptor domain-containing protein [Mycobacteriales bacterium]|nr:toll/interleukin-1 receptor domain-containing protein [Mycobacteriales bacterium]
MAQFNASQFRQQLQAAQRQHERAVREAERKINDYNRQVNEHNRRVVAGVNAYNREVSAYNQQVARHVGETNRQIDTRNQAADAHNREVVSNLDSALRKAQHAPTVTYTPAESALVERVQDAVGILPSTKEKDVFLSYARIDGATTATALQAALEGLGVSVWFDAASIKPGHSMSRQMDDGLRKARAGVVLLTPAYLTGRFWTERELGVLLHKNTVIPVLHLVTFTDVGEYSGILTDLAGFTTQDDSIETIALKISEAVLPLTEPGIAAG